MNRSMYQWILLAWQERNTDFTTHEAWGVPAYERTRWFLHRLQDAGLLRW